jgi:hypothetical protein
MKTIPQNIPGLLVAGIALVLLLWPAPAVLAGGRYPLSLTELHGDVQVRRELPGTAWQKAKLGPLEHGTYLVRTGPRAYAHISGKFRCLDADSLIRINLDSEASIDVLRGQISAVDGKRGKSLPDDVH